MRIDHTRAKRAEKYIITLMQTKCRNLTTGSPNSGKTAATQFNQLDAVLATIKEQKQQKINIHESNQSMDQLQW